MKQCQLTPASEGCAGMANLVRPRIPSRARKKAVRPASWSPMAGPLPLQSATRLEAAMTDPEFLSVPLVYVGIEDVPILYANQFIIQHQQDEFIISVGQLSPPVLLGDESEQREQAERLSYVPVKVVARLALTRQRLTELITVLQGKRDE